MFEPSLISSNVNIFNEILLHRGGSFDSHDEKISVLSEGSGKSE